MILTSGGRSDDSRKQECMLLHCVYRHSGSLAARWLGEIFIEQIDASATLYQVYPVILHLIEGI